MRMLLRALETLSETILHKQPKKKDRGASRKLQTGVPVGKGTEGMSAPAGLPVVSRPLRAPPQTASSRAAADADTIAACRPDRAGYGCETPPRSTKADAPLPPKRRRKAKGRAEPEHEEQSEITSREVAGSAHDMFDRMD